MYDSETFDNLKTYGFASTINAELGSLNLKSITSYRYLKTDALNDTDGTVAPLLATFGGSKSKSYSQEFQISGDVTDLLSFDWKRVLERKRVSVRVDLGGSRNVKTKIKHKK